MKQRMVVVVIIIITKTTSTTHLQPQTPRRDPPTHYVTVTPLPRHSLLCKLLVFGQRFRQKHVEIGVTHGLARVVIARANGGGKRNRLAGAAADCFGATPLEQTGGSGFVAAEEIEKKSETETWL